MAMDEEVAGDLVFGLREAMHEVAEWCKRKGWEPDLDRTFGDECALLHSEVSEALEAFREKRFAETLQYEFPNGEHGKNVVYWQTDLPEPRITLEGYLISGPASFPVSEAAQRLDIVPKPCGVASEFADILVRLLHYSYVHQIDIGNEFLKKMRYNEVRSYRHGGKAL